uniref:LRR receptor-like serine/threonine-protein kinase GSO2 n=1 Tax=Cajanus cajan TaxID=3821 RepID=A0A151QMA3_CAJCA|nr:LRR receptor-like serine/threonine-protein kinase GSO2 [Cajanus cajan]
MLSTWREDEDNRDCCTWKGIHCNNETGQVHVLHLRGSETHCLIGTINITSLIHLQNIEHVDLSHNDFIWNGQVHSQLGNLSKLKYLDLWGNSFSGAIPFQVGNLPMLQTLRLGANKLQGEIPASLSNIFTLQELYLKDNNLSGEISSFIHNSTQYKRHLLQTLDLSFNRITALPPNFSILTSLRRLDISYNQLSGEIPKSIGLLYQLEYLHLEGNHLEGDINELHLTNLSKLQELDLTDNSFLKGTIPNLPIKLTDDYYAIILGSNQLKGEIPTFLSQASALDLSKNKISDLNSFLCTKSATIAMFTLDLSNNQITGQLPNCWKHLKYSLAYLDLSNNKLSGKIPKSIGTLVNLQGLVLRNNSLTGGLPFTLKNCTNLDILDVSDNFLFGPIPLWIGENLQNLKILSLRVNGFFKSVPVNLCYLRQIHLLDLSRNNLSGGIPTCLGNFAAMMEREITSEIVKGRKITSTETNIDIYDSNVLFTWKSQDYVFWNPENLLKSIDLSSNDLTGAIPKEIGYLLGLISLNLSRNKLDGEIPTEIGNLSWLEFLDLSRNHFFGKIPFTLSKIDSLGVLDLSNNDLNGRIPWEGHLETFDASSFEGNLELCGEPLNKSCPGDKTTAKPEESAVDGEEDNSVFNEALYMSLGLGFFAGFWGLLGPIILWKPWRIAYLRFLNRVTDYVLVTVELNIAKCCRWSES